MASRSSKNTHYHFELAYDDTARQWRIIDDYDGLKLRQIRDNGKWRDSLTPSEDNKLRKRKRELEELITALNSAKESSTEALSLVESLRI